MLISEENLRWVYPTQAPVGGLRWGSVTPFLSAAFLHVVVFSSGMLIHHWYGSPGLVTAQVMDKAMVVEVVVEEMPQPLPLEEPEVIQEEEIVEYEEEIQETFEEDEPDPLPEPMAESEEDVAVIEQIEKPKPRIANVKPKTKPRPKPKPQPVALRREAVQKVIARAPITQAVVKVKSKPGLVKPVYPAYLRNPTPPYPKKAKRRRLEGTVLLFVQVDERGRALHVRVKESSGHTILDSSALRTVKNWRFLPARINNIAVVSDVLVPIRFKLKSSY